MDTFGTVMEGESISAFLQRGRMNMAFVKDKTGSAQTAANAAAVVVAAFAAGFEDFDAAVEAFNGLRTEIYEDLAVIVDADNEKFAAEDKGSSNGGSKAKSGSRSSKSSGGSKSRSSKSGGGSKRGGGSISLEDALGLELSWGAFEGETLETVLGLSAEECDDTYGYGEGERDGRDYITWLASDSNNVEFVQKRARVIADAEDIDY